MQSSPPPDTITPAERPSPTPAAASSGEPASGLTLRSAEERELWRAILAVVNQWALPEEVHATAYADAAVLAYRARLPEVPPAATPTAAAMREALVRALCSPGCRAASVSEAMDRWFACEPSEQEAAADLAAILFPDEAPHA